MQQLENHSRRVERRIIAILWLELLHQNHFQVQTNSKKPVEKGASASVYFRGHFTFINMFKLQGSIHSCCFSDSKIISSLAN